MNHINTGTMRYATQFTSTKKVLMCSTIALVVTWEDWCRLTLSRYQPAGRQGGLFVLLKCQWFTSLLSSNKGKPKQNDLGYNFYLRLWLASQAHRKFDIPPHPTILWTNNLPKPRSKLEWRPQESNNKINKKQIFTRTPTLPKLGLCLNIYRQQTAITAAGSLKTPPKYAAFSSCHQPHNSTPLSWL